MKFVYGNGADSLAFEGTVADFDKFPGAERLLRICDRLADNAGSGGAIGQDSDRCLHRRTLVRPTVWGYVTASSESGPIPLGGACVERSGVANVGRFDCTFESVDVGSGPAVVNCASDGVTACGFVEGEKKSEHEVVGEVKEGESVSARTLANREKRKKHKERKLRKQQDAILSAEMKRMDKIVGSSASVSVEPGSNVTSASGSSTACDVKPIQQRVDDSVKEKWILKNKLETMELERKIKLLQNTRVEDDIKAANLKVRAAIERQMVGIEKTHSKLAASDCVPVDDLTDAERSSRVHTLQSGLSPDTISPNSSASMAEFRAVQKKNLDLEKTNEKLREMLEKCGIDRVRQEIAAKSEWTCDENMCLTEENEKLICQTDIGYVGPLDGPHLCDDGKYRMELDLYDDRERVMYIDPFGAN